MDVTYCKVKHADTDVSAGCSTPGKNEQITSVDTICCIRINQDQFTSEQRCQQYARHDNRSLLQRTCSAGRLSMIRAALGNNEKPSELPQQLSNVLHTATKTADNVNA
jgi:hypothetical protein